MYREGRMWLWIFALAVVPAVTLSLLPGSLGTASARGPQPEWTDEDVEDAPRDPSRNTSAFPPLADGVVETAVAEAKSLDATTAQRGRKRLRSVTPEARAVWSARLRPRAAQISSEVEATLSLLDDLRRRARDPEERFGVASTVYDPDLSLRAYHHATFLTHHPDLGWPEGHHENPKFSDSSPEGDAAGRHSVIAFTSGTIRDGIDVWMSTYFHRLPILEGALAVGWGSSGRIQVLDLQTLAVGGSHEGDLRWPADGAVDVPLRFDLWGEAPAPAPGFRDRALGYPITLQAGRRSDLRGVRGSLRVHRAAGWEEVPCLLSSPEAPLQPQCVPWDTVCLLPRRALDPGAEHEVTFGSAGGRTVRWNFTTVGAEADVEALLTRLAGGWSDRRVAGRVLRALDVRWEAALPALTNRPGLSADDAALLAEVRSRIRGERERIEGRTLDDWIRDHRVGSLRDRVDALWAAGTLLDRVRDRVSDPTAYEDDSPDAATALRFVREDCDSPEDALREAALEVLRASGTRHRGYESMLVAHADDIAPVVRRCALEALQDLAPRSWEAMHVCFARLRDEDAEVRWTAALALGPCGAWSRDVGWTLLLGAESGDLDRRVLAAQGLGRMDPHAFPEARETLERLVRDDPSPSVRRAAQRALMPDK